MLYKPVLKNSGSPGVVDPTHRAALVNITPLWHCAHLSRSLRNSASPRWAASDSAPVLPRWNRSYGESPDTNVRSNVAIALVTLPNVIGAVSPGNDARNSNW